MKLAEYIAEWLRKTGSSVRYSTYAQYQYLNHMLEPLIREEELETFDAARMQHLADTLSGLLSRRTVSNALVFVRMALRHAMRNGVVPFATFDQVRVRAEKTFNDRPCLTPEEFDRMTGTEKIIEDTLGGLFLNLSHVKEHQLGHRYRAYTGLTFVFQLLPELKKAGIVRKNYQPPTRECIRCLEGFFRRGDRPSDHCRSLAQTHPTPPVPEWSNCPILHRWDYLRKQGSTDQALNCTKSTSRNTACESKTPYHPPLVRITENNTDMRNFRDAPRLIEAGPAGTENDGEKQK